MGIFYLTAIYFHMRLCVIVSKIKEASEACHGTRNCVAYVLSSLLAKEFFSKSLIMSAVLQ